MEKAGLDSIATKESDDVPYLLNIAYEQIYKVLKPGGVFVSISNKNFGKIINLKYYLIDFWYEKVQKNFFHTKQFELVTKNRTTFTIPNDPTLMNVYFYFLKCVKE